MEDKDKSKPEASIHSSEVEVPKELLEFQDRIAEIKKAEAEKNEAVGGGFGSHLAELEPTELTLQSFDLFDKADQYFQTIYGENKPNWWAEDFDETDFFKNIGDMSKAELEKHQESVYALKYPNLDFLRDAPKDADRILVEGILNKLQSVLLAVQMTLRKPKNNE